MLKVNTIKNLSINLTHLFKYRKLSAKANLSATAISLFDNPYDNLPEEFRDQIHFSSYLEDKKPKLGYKKKKILEGIIQKRLLQERIDNCNVRPFPAALSALGLDTKIKSEKQEHDADVKNVVDIEPAIGREVMPKRWMQDYEFYEENDEDSPVSVYGTSDPSVPPSNVPCNGCGAHLHCADPGLPGYLPGEIFKGRKDKELKLITCQRCHFLKTYNIALDVTVPPETYVETISTIQDKYALVILIVDLLDFPCSIWPGIQRILGERRPVFVVGNKVDLLPKDTKGYLDHIRKCLKNEIVKAGLTEINIKKVSLISAKTGYGVEELITQLHQIWAYRGDVYLVGCTNVGKSSLFNALLRSDYCKVEASDLVKKATTCPWPGTTLQMLKFPILRPSDIRVWQRFQRLFSERGQRRAENKLRLDQMRKSGKVEHATLMGHIGRTFIKPPEETNDMFSMVKGTDPILTLDEKAKTYANSKWCYDTPGVIQPEQIHNLLTTEELLLLAPKEMIVPRVFRIKPNMTLFLAGLGRLDFLRGDVETIRISVYSSADLPLVICSTDKADDVYKNFVGTEMLAVPRGGAERLARWPGLDCSDEITIVGQGYNQATCDLLLSSAGWVGLSVHENQTCTFRAWTPFKRGIVIRSPPLIPYGEHLRGQKIRDSVAYRVGKPFIKQ